MLALVAEWYTQQVEGLCREAWWFESTRGHLIKIQGTLCGCPISVPLFILQGRLAQLVRAAALHAVGLGFESLVAHSFALFLRLEKLYYSERCSEEPEGGKR